MKWQDSSEKYLLEDEWNFQPDSSQFHSLADYTL